MPGALESLACQQTHDEFTYDVFVVDNASTDDTLAVVETFAETSPIPVHYCYEAKPGDAPPRNHGIKHSTSPWLAFFDDDQFATPLWLAELLRVAIVRNARIVGGPVHLDLPDEIAAGLSRSCRRTLREMKPYDSARTYDAADIPGTGNMLVHRSVFDDVGSFDESMQAGGSDWRLVNSARRRGIEPWYAPDAVIRHRVEDDRMTRSYFRWDSLNGGATVAREHHHTRGLAGLAVGCAARLARLGCYLPRLVWDRLRPPQVGVAESRMMAWRTEAYLREAISLVAPRLCPQRGFHRMIEFRAGRMAGSV
ncbi:MAG: glycosyltransferase family A protein [Planctomycetota bacterium]|nr:glycosyltransferase family A protein [Planctomycetota bacterium]